MANPYKRNWENYRKDFAYDMPFGQDGGEPIYITHDGKIKARGFIDVNDDLEIYLEKDELRCRFIQDNSKSLVYTVATDVEATYRHEGTQYESLDGGIQNYVKPLHTFESTETYPKYRKLNKTTKALVSSLVTVHRPFHFHIEKSGIYYPKPKIESSWFGPFNYDIYIKPNGVVKDFGDIFMVKSGTWAESPVSVVEYGAKAVMYSTGISGAGSGDEAVYDSNYVYVDTTSLPSHGAGPFMFGGAPEAARNATFKMPRTGNANRKPAVVPSGIPTGAGAAIGLFYNGVFLHSPYNTTSYEGSGVWTVNTAQHEDHLEDPCGGKIQTQTADDAPFVGTYYYDHAPKCLYDIEDTSNHSPLLGFAIDGYPIYGPYAYSGSSTTTVKRMESSYRIKQLADRTVTDPNHLSPTFGEFPSGSFHEDWEFVQGHGDLDEHNGRTGITPDYPTGTYAYFTTVDSDHAPYYPYAIGKTFYGEVRDEWYAGVSTVTEPAEIRFYISPRSNLLLTYPEVDINLWEAWGDANKGREGLDRETIIFVSPHILRQANEGVFLQTGYIQSTHATGIWDYSLNTGSGISTHHGNRFMATGNMDGVTGISGIRHGAFLPLVTGYRFPSSLSTQFIDGAPLSGSMTYFFADTDTFTLSEAVSPATVTATEFYEVYSGYKPDFGHTIEYHNAYLTDPTRTRKRGVAVSTSFWDGKIPSGVPFKLECWSFNGVEIGFNGRFQFAPCVPHPLVSGQIPIFIASVTGEGPDAIGAENDYNTKIQAKLRREHNILMVNSGLRNMNSKMLHYRDYKNYQG